MDIYGQLLANKVYQISQHTHLRCIAPESTQVKYGNHCRFGILLDTPPYKFVS